ncbi:methyl-accepting chemotaxis protein [Bacillus tianshenii]|nr:methyl-accepting chemotaxis protein [Bacillus tianshenii]
MKHLHTKLIIMFAALIFVTLTAVSVITSTQLKKEIGSDALRQAEGNIRNMGKTIDLYLEKYSTALLRYETDETVKQYIANVSEQSNMTNTMMRNSLKNYIEVNQNVNLIYIGTPAKTIMLEPDISEQLSADFDPTTRPWYQSAKSAPSEVIWTKPYIDDATNEITITGSKAIIENGKVIGVIGLDLNLDNVANIINNSQTGYDGYSILLDQEGTALIHPDKVGENLTDYSFIKEIYASNTKEGSTEYTVDGEERILVYDQVEHTNWIVGTVFAKKVLNQTANNAQFTIFIISAISVIVACFIVYFAAKYLVKPLVHLKEQVNRVANGDLTAHADVNSRDEIGKLTMHFNEMVKQMRSLIMTVEQSVDQVRTSAESFSTVTEQSSTSASEVTKAVAEIADGTQEASADVESTNQLMMKLSEQIENVNNFTTEMDKLSHNAEGITNEGIRQMDVLRDKSNESDEVTANVEKVIHHLADKIKEIGQVINSINDISAQTNLLALNASIEAARAGEHGKGFAVVAEEVRKLAEQSAMATDSVRDIITGIQEEANLAVSEMEHTKAISSEQLKVVHETEKGFKGIAEMIHKMIHATEHISSEMGQINLNKNEVVAAIQSISAMLQQTAASCEEVSASADEQVKALYSIVDSAENLNRSSEQLNVQIHKFQV